MNRPMKCFISLLVAGFLLSGCSATHLVSSWREPSLPAGGASKLLVIALTQQEMLRHKIEDEYVRQLAAQGINAEQSYRFFPDEKQIVPETVKAKLPEIGRDAVLVTHFVDVKTETVYVPPSTSRFPSGRWYSGGYQRPSYYNNFSSYYNHSYSVVARPGYTYDYKIYVVETNLYAASEQLLWTAVTETKEPTSLDTAVRDFVEVIRTDMRENSLF